MTVTEVTDFETDFSAHFDTPLRPVKVVRNLDPATFQKRFVQPGIPIILDDQMLTWRALKRWADPAYLTGLAGGSQIYLRDLEIATGMVLADMARLMMMQALRRGDRELTLGPARYR